MSLKIKILPAENGDLHLIEIDDNIIMVDTGTKNTYSKGILKSLSNTLEKIDLLILTHIDEDHIGGICRFFEDSNRPKDLIKEVWFNSPKGYSSTLSDTVTTVTNIQVLEDKIQDMSTRQGLSLEIFLSKETKWRRQIISAGDKFILFGATWTFLSPEKKDLYDFLKKWTPESDENLKMSNKSDYNCSVQNLLDIPFIEIGSIANKTSIAFLLTYKGNNFLFMGDAHSSIVEGQLRKLGFNEKNRLKLEMFKLSHHGSKYGLGKTLLSILDCNKFSISTNGRYNHPDKECLSKVVQNINEVSCLYFNYNNSAFTSIFSEEEKKMYRITSVFPSEQEEYIICEFN